MAMPTAVPTMPDSASGLSMTPSSPMTRTFGSSSIALRSPLLRPLASVIFSVMSVSSLERLEVRRELGVLLAQLVGLLGVHHVEDVQRLRVGQRLHAVTEPGAEVVGLGRH